MSDLLTINIIGAGQLGRVLARAWHETTCYQIQSVFSRRLGAAEAACAFIGGGQATAQIASVAPADVCVISTPDSAIESALGELLDHGAIASGTLVLHCSGFKDSTVLMAAESRAKAHIASVHPAMSFADPIAAYDHLKSGALCAIEGPEVGANAASNLMRSVGFRVFPVGSGQKALYHAACVFANNYAVTLLSSAQALLNTAGVPKAYHDGLLSPLMQQAVEGVQQRGAVNALSGPVARADAEAVLQQHQKIQAEHPALAELYALLALQTVDLAKAQRGESHEALTRLSHLLKDRLLSEPI